MTHQEAKTIKQAVKEELIAAFTEYEPRLTQIDPRLKEYVLDCIDPMADHANLYELLGIRKFIRMLYTYPFHTEKVQRIYRAYEHLKFSGINGKQQYKLTPLQTFQLAAPFGFMRSQDDWRRICTEANYFIPRKSSKTTLAAFFNFWFFFFEDYNAECFCCSNSADQSKILHRITSDLLKQLDPKGTHIRFTATEVTWYNSNERESKVVALSAGGKTKDGLFAQLCCADEYGSAGYVKDKSDMANLVNVVEGSMGPRREPMTVITTTAGRVNEGPYQVKLRGIQQALLLEATYPLLEPYPTDNDWQFALICCPDQWEENDEDLQRPEVWRKVNRHIGVTVQPDFYENEWRKMLQDPEKKKEQITKLFNVWQSARVKHWLTASDIYPLQVERRVTDLDSSWLCFVGCDFSKGDDLNALSYLCYHPETGEFFADCDAWTTEETMQSHTNAALYQMWHQQGWLRVCPGRTISEDMVTQRLMEVAEHPTILRIGYDAYDSRRFINAFGAWIFSLGQQPDKYLQTVSQTFATFNSPVQEMQFMIKNDPPLIHFSHSPLWGWEFGNCMLQESNDGMENTKPVKCSANSKIDNIICLLMALHLYDQMQGTVQ
jgi:phage terminase large subunit-like protein